MKNLLFIQLLSLLITFISTDMAAQSVTLTSFPQDNQLYPRSYSTNQALIPIQGSLTDSPFTGIFLKVYKDNYEISKIDLTLSEGSFNYLHSITAALSSYTFELYGSRATFDDELLQTAQNVVAGDVITITGQSNAQATQYQGDANTANSTYRDFVRVYGNGSSNSTTFWYTGNGNVPVSTNGSTGQWGMALAALIVQNHQIPVAVMNGSAPGQPISYFQKVSASTGNNYNRLLSRLKNSGLKDHAQTIYFHQGESDAIASRSITYYKNQLQTLLDSWKADYPNLKFVYLFQIRAGCGAPLSNSMNIIQAQLEFAQENASEVRLLSTNNTTQIDNCHFPYSNGYYEFARRAFWLTDQDVYGQPLRPNQTAPYPARAYLDKNENGKINLILRNELDTFSIQGNLMADLILEGSANYSITSTSIQDSILSINYMIQPLSGAEPTGLTFLSHSGPSEPALINSNGIGMVSFKNFRLDQIHNDSSPSEPPLINMSPAQIRASERFWKFDRKASLDFGVNGTQSASSTEFGVQNSRTGEGYATATNAEGTLQFYASPSQIYDSTGHTTINGSMNGSISTQGVIVLPHLRNFNRYIIVYNNTNVGANPNGNLYYAVFDKTSNTGLGDLVAKNLIPHPTGASLITNEMITYAPNASGDGFWLVSAINNTSCSKTSFACSQEETRIYAIEVTFPSDDTIQFGTPVISSVGNMFNGYGSIEFNNDYSRAIILSSYFGTTSFLKRGTLTEMEFNSHTGAFKRRWSMTLPQLGGQNMYYSADYSPSEQYAFVSTVFGNIAFRYDLSSGNNVTIQGTQQSFHSPNAAYLSGAVRKGPNDKMYFASYNAQNVWEVSNPEASNVSSFNFQGKSFGTGGSSFGFSQTSLGISLDFGDAPDSYGTSILNNGAHHKVLYNLRGTNMLALGSTVNSEPDGTPIPTANHDTDDGITYFPTLYGGASSLQISQYSVNITTTNLLKTNAYLSGWIDWNNNGTFDPEEISTSIISPGQPLATLYWTNPSLSASPGTVATYARFRISSDQGVTANGFGDNGEVEDYTIPINPPLPISLLNFKIKLSESRVFLTWSTTSESNSSHFDIERSQNGKDWSPIGQMDAYGESTVLRNYAFTDPSPFSGENLYRLKMVDLDDTFAYSRIRSLDFKGTSNELAVYPNPAQEYVTLQNPEQVLSYRLIGPNGQTLLSDPRMLDTQGKLQLGKITPGMYVLTIQRKGGVTEHHKLVIDK